MAARKLDRLVALVVPDKTQRCSYFFLQSSSGNIWTNQLVECIGLEGRCLENYQILFWLAGTLGIVSKSFLKIAADRLFLSVGKILNNFEKKSKIELQKWDLEQN